MSNAPRDPYLESLAELRDRIKRDRARYSAQAEAHPRWSRLLRAIARAIRSR